MNEQVDVLTQRIAALEAELAAELAKRRAGLRFGLKRGRVLFEEEILRRHRELRTSLFRYIIHARPLIMITAPVIYALIVPLVLLDLSVMLYQAVCFPAYGIAKVRRSDYLAFDRGHLAYLNALEKLNCANCSYANGLIGFVPEVAARTEAYWCPIKHARRVLSVHAYYTGFADYGDADAYRHKIAELTAPAADGRPGDSRS